MRRLITRGVLITRQAYLMSEDSSGEVVTSQFLIKSTTVKFSNKINLLSEYFVVRTSH